MNRVNSRTKLVLLDASVSLESAECLDLLYPHRLCFSHWTFYVIVSASSDEDSQNPIMSRHKQQYSHSCPDTELKAF